MQQEQFTILENQPLTASVFRMVLAGNAGEIRKPGQFVEVRLPGFFLRRPISVCDWQDNRLTLIYKVAGQGTQAMTAMAPGTPLDVLTGLGNGYDLSPAGQNPVLVGGGVGVPPLYALCKALLAEGKSPAVVLGFNTKDEVFYQRELQALGGPVTVTTVDGSQGIPGFVTAGLPQDYTYVYACGPLPMLRAVNAEAKTPGQFSMEERMGCGFGACMGCTIQTKHGPKRVCKDGPVFLREEVML